MIRFWQRAFAIRLSVTLTFLTMWGATAVGSAEPPSRWSTEDVTFRSADGVALSGSLISPQDSLPTAVVVLVHGSGPAERYTALGAIMALRGIAVLTYDKRGVGRSGGEYEASDNVGRTNLQLLASDASAAMAWLSIEPRLRALPRGFVGISQAGWVIPLALPSSQGVDFVGFWSGPVCTTSEQLHFQQFSEARQYDPSHIDESEAAEAMQRVTRRPDDVDPLKDLANETIPMLWLFGEKDPYVPVQLSVRRLEHLIDTGRSNFSIHVFPNEGHNLADSPRQESFIAMTDWINQTATKLPQ